MNKKASLLAAMVLVPAALWTSSTFAASDDAARPEPRSHSGATQRDRRSEPPFGTGVTRTVADVDGGAAVTLVSTDAAVTAKIQAYDWAQEWSRLEGAAVSVEARAGGVTVTVTSSDADVAARIREMAARAPGQGRPEGEGFGSGAVRPEFGSGSQRPARDGDRRAGKKASVTASGSVSAAPAKSARHDAVAKQVKSRLSTSLSAIDKLPSEQRSAVYAQVVAKVDGLASAAASSGDASSAELYAILKEVLLESSAAR